MGGWVGGWVDQLTSQSIHTAWLISIKNIWLTLADPASSLTWWDICFELILVAKWSKVFLIQELCSSQALSWGGIQADLSTVPMEKLKIQESESLLTSFSKCLPKNRERGEREKIDLHAILEGD